MEVTSLIQKEVYKLRQLRVPLDSSVGSRDPHQFDYLFHDIYIISPLEIAPGIKYSRRWFAHACLQKDVASSVIEFDKALIGLDQSKRILLVQKFAKWIQTKYEGNFNPWTFQCIWEDWEKIMFSSVENDEATVTSSSNDDPDTQKIREKRAQGLDWGTILEQCLAEVDSQQALETLSRDCSKVAASKYSFNRRKIMFLLAVEELKQQNLDIPQIVANLNTDLGKNSKKKQTYVHVGGIPFTHERYYGAYKEADMPQMAFRLFKKYLHFRFFALGKFFKDFQSVCPVVRLAIYQCCKFLMLEKASGKMTPMDFDHTCTSCHVFPTWEECQQIDQVVTQESLKEQEKCVATSDSENGDVFMQTEAFLSVEMQANNFLHTFDLNFLDFDGNNILLSSSTDDQSCCDANYSAISSTTNPVICDHVQDLSGIMPSCSMASSNPMASTSTQNQQFGTSSAILGQPIAVADPPQITSESFAACTDPNRPKIGGITILDADWNKARTALYTSSKNRLRSAAKIFHQNERYFLPEERFCAIASRLPPRGTEKGEQKLPTTSKLKDLVEAMKHLFETEMNFGGVAMKAVWEELVQKELKSMLTEHGSQNRARKKKNANFKTDRK